MLFQLEEYQFLLTSRRSSDLRDSTIFNIPKIFQLIVSSGTSTEINSSSLFTFQLIQAAREEYYILVLVDKVGRSSVVWISVDPTAKSTIGLSLADFLWEIGFYE